MLIHSSIRNFILGTLIIFTSVPFCFGQQPQLSLRAERNNPLIQSAFSLSSLNFSTSQSSFLSMRGAEQRRNLSVSDTLKSDTVKTKTSYKKFKMKKSPWLAVGLSAVLPGAGQFYNRSYWKVPVITGLAGYFVYEYIQNDKQYRDYRDQYAASQTPENQYMGDQNLKTLREFYRNQRNDYVWYFVILYFVNLVDAYVDAHLFDFTVKEDKLTRFGLTDKEYTLNIRVKF